MKRRYILLLLIFMTATIAGVNAQSMSDMKINEILVTNTNDFVDDFGHKGGWIELFNSSYGTVNIGGCYLTNDPANLTKYRIPSGDVLTRIKPRQHILFWADNQPHRGTFHINFTLEESEEILLVSSDGRTIIDRVTIPHETLSENVSYGRIIDGVDVIENKVTDISKTWAILPKTSPSTNNYGTDLESAGVLFKKIDPYGVIMALTAMSVVFLSLILLYTVFRNIGNYNIRISRRNAELAATKHNKKLVTEEEISAEVFAAISLAIHTYFEDEEAHDYEHTILTIDKVTRNYSPWSSKIYTLRETPKRK